MRKIALIACVLAAVAIPARGQDRGGRGGRAGGPVSPPAPSDVATPAEIQRLFDAYVVMQAQQELQLSDEQFPKFVARVRALQDVRRRGQMERGRLIQELRRQLQATGQDDQMRTTLKAITDLDARVATEEAQAMDGVNQVLDLRQQARFRVLEEQMERRKVELLMRARQANRPKNQF